MEKMDLSFFFKTKDQAVDFSTRLAAVIDKMYMSNFNLESALSESLGIQKKDKFLSFLINNGIHTESTAVLKQYFEKLRQEIASLPILSVTIAFIPNEQTLAAMSEWFQLNSKIQVLFDIKVDHNLIAGAAILINGRYADFSIKSTFNEIFNNVAEATRSQIKQEETQPENPHKTTPQQAEYMSLGR